MVLPPSSEELQQGKATLMCLANKGFPSDWNLAWKMETGRRAGAPWSWRWMGSTLRLPADQWWRMSSVNYEATRGSQTPVSETLRRDQ
uniref:Immunoglobulin C1-set domain-containing protein n=1 Tax=Monopterus albus TaxID=43700 RepID=A0A3Q3JIQ3_MONAL